jgi:hypothetical protein
MLSALDYVQIQNLLNLYPHIIDVPENYHRGGEVFDTDGVFDAGELGRYEGLSALIEYWSHSPKRAAVLAQTRLLSHNVANIVISESPDGTATCESRCIAVSVDGTVSVAVYHDILRKTERGWRIALRRVERMVPPTVDVRGA